MEESRRKVRKSLKLIISFAVLILSIVGITVYNCIIYSDEHKKTISLQTTLAQLNDENDRLKAVNSSLNKEIDDLKNIDNIITSTKENVFKLAALAEKNIQEGKTNYKIAYITFDDGPYYLTNDVLKTLREKKVKATFFTIGKGKNVCYDNRSYNCIPMYKKEVSEGHTIANHTYSHDIFDGLYDSANTFMQQVTKQENLIMQQTGVKTNIVRFPGGSRTAGRLKDGIINNLKKNGYGWVDWTAQDGDGGAISSKTQAWRNLMDSINSNIEVILFHDYSTTTYSLLGEAIDYLENNDYILLPLFYDSIMVNK